jgi:hypothetical protein
MSTRRLDLIGHRFGMLVVVRYVGANKNRAAVWACSCDCGGERITLGNSLRRGNAVTCGCKPGNYKHGGYRTRAYNIRHSIIGRCHNERNKDFGSYGGRGISVCSRWIESLSKFLEDMGEPPTPQHSIDRIDNSGNYEPGNCRWATADEQGKNKRNNHMVEYMGERMCVSDWATRVEIPDSVIGHRLRVGWSVERALTTPVANRKR